MLPGIALVIILIFTCCATESLIRLIYGVYVAISHCLGMQDSNFSKLLRKELPEDKKEKILGVIDQVAQNEAV